MRLHRFVVAISLFLLLAAGCGGGGTEEATPTPTCTTVTPGPDGSPTPTPTPCLVGATGAPPSAEPTGEVWEGTAEVSSYANYPEGSASCQDGWKIAFSFVADAGGTIEGQGTADLTAGPTCTFPIGPTVKHVEYLVLGERTSGGFSVRFELGTWQPEANEGFYGGVSEMWSAYAGCPAPVEVAVSGNSGTGEGAWQCQFGNPPATEGANGTFTLTCVECEEPVG